MLKAVFRHSLILILFLSYNGFGQSVNGVISTSENFFLQGVNHDKKFNVEIDEIDVAPVQIQGPKSVDLMADLVGDAVRDIPYYGLMEAKVGGRDCIISQTGFTGEKGYEIYLKDATKYADDMWYDVL